MLRPPVFVVLHPEKAANGRFRRLQEGKENSDGKKIFIFCCRRHDPMLPGCGAKEDNKGK